MKFRFIVVLGLSAFLLSSCGTPSLDSKEALMVADRLSKKYGEKVTLTGIETLYYVSIGDMFGGKIAGIQGDAIISSDQPKTFRYEYWEERDTVEDNYINFLMADKLSAAVKEKVSNIWSTDNKIDAHYLYGVFGSMSDEDLSPNSEISDYSVSSAIDVFIPYKGEVNKTKEANKILKLHNDLKSLGVSDFSTAVFYMAAEDYKPVEKTLADIESHNEHDYNLYNICRTDNDCLVSGGDGSESVSELIDKFDLRNY